MNFSYHGTNIEHETKEKQSRSLYNKYSVSQKITPSDLRFSYIFSQTVENFKSVFTHLLHVPIYAR